MKKSMSNETKDKLSKLMKARWSDKQNSAAFAAARQNSSVIMKRVWAEKRDEIVRNQSAGTTKAWSDPVKKEQRLARRQETLTRNCCLKYNLSYDEIIKLPRKKRLAEYAKRSKLNGC